MQPGWQKKLLLLESGVRLHMTHFDREKDLPSGFCLKLRKHIRTKRLDAVNQLGGSSGGGDRILDLVFSSAGETSSHLIVEAFSGGNVILTDASYTILTLLRTYRQDHPSAPLIAVKQPYPLQAARAPAPLTLTAFRTAAHAALAAAPAPAALAAAGTRAAKRALRARTAARSALASALSTEPTLIEHALLTARFAADATLEAVCSDDTRLDAVYDALAHLDTALDAAIRADAPVPGYIVSVELPAPDGVGTREKFDQFSPYLLEQYRDRPYTRYATFDEAADVFFASLETERADASQAKREAAAFKKVDKLASELKGQVSILETARDLSWERAQAIESNIVEVEAAITVIRSAVAAAVSWDGLARMVKDEKKNGNPVAEIIHSLQLERNEITLMLEDTFGIDDEEDEEEDDDEDDDANEKDDEDEDDEEEEDDASEEDGDGDIQHVSRGKKRSKFEPSAQTRKALLVPVDLGLGAHANARRHYAMRKSAAAKMERAVEVTDRTIKAASRKAANEAHKLEAEAAAASIRARRKALWFEKFFWFVSSENYLVVAGRDAQQNELLVKRYLGPADVYVHADLQGASSVIVKNQRHLGAGSHAEIPRMTLEQAGTFAMCRSAAWDAKIVTSAWWVRASQVSKTTPSGTYLPPGSFVIRGKKNFLDPTQLVMGFAFLFKVDELSAQKHHGERGVRGLEEEQGLSTDVTAGVVETAQGSADVGADVAIDRTAYLRTAEELQSQQVLTSSTSDEAALGGSGEREGSSSSQSDEPQSAATEQPSKYAVAQTGDSSHAVPGDSNAAKVPRAKKKHLSARERKALRSGKGAGGKKPVDSGEDNQEEDNASVAGNAKSERKKTSDSKQNLPLPRGKKHKLKKMKKYSDQDDEERRIALAVLGSKPMKGEEEEAVSAKAIEGAEESEDASGNGKGTPENDDASSSRKQNRPEKQEPMRLLDEEGLAELGRLEEDTTQTLTMLTARPEASDAVQCALPICAPYVALTNYRYKVKLMPGSTKRGKAYRSAVALFLKQAEKDLTQFKQERDSLRLSPESDGIQGMLGGVRIMAPGLAEAQKSLQKAKKGSTKKGSKK